VGNRPVPNLDEVDIEDKHHVQQESDTRLDIGFPWERPENGEWPRGWDNPWPDLPSPDSPRHHIDISKIRLSVDEPPCTGGYLGYYMPWHVIAISYRNERGWNPIPTESQIRDYNNQLPIGNRFGIHICCNELNSYIERFRTDNIDPALRTDYLNYCKHLALIWVVAHEWGHYRSEVLSFQLTNILTSVTGADNSIYHPSFISYWRNKKRYPDENFEEVFAEWASLKMGIFNYHMPDLALNAVATGQDQAKTVLREQMAIAMISRNRPLPYRQIGSWVNMNRLTNDAYLSRVVTKSKSMNRSVNDNTRILDDSAFKNVRMIDLLMHNQIQFSSGIPSFEIIRSQDSRIARRRLAGIYRHIGDDECLVSKGVSSISKNFLGIDLSQSTGGRCCADALKPFLIDGDRGNFPIPIFPDILDIDPVYFHC
jgi:hypothetical protein